MLPKAFIFDLDGVIANTDEYHYRAWRQLADDLHLEFHEGISQKIKGIARLRSLEIILEENCALDKYTAEQISAFADEKNNYYGEMVLEITRRDMQRGIMHILESARDNGLKLGLTTISRNGPVVVKNLDVVDCFDFVDYSYDPKRQKIDAAVFTACANGLGIPTAECVGFGGSVLCVSAINEAGMFSVGIDLTREGANANYTVASTKELSFHRIMREFEESHQV